MRYSLPFCIGLLTLLVGIGCKTPVTLKGPSAKIDIIQPYDLKTYSQAEVCCYQTQLDIDPTTLDTLYLITRSAAIAADVFYSVNGLSRLAVLPVEDPKMISIVPYLDAFDIYAPDCRLNVRFELLDHETAEKIGAFSIEARGGSAGPSAAIQRMALAFQEVLRR